MANMLGMDEIQMRLLREVADLHKVPEGAYNIRSNSEAAGRQSTANIEIVPKEGGSGIDIYIKPGTKKESVHIYRADEKPLPCGSGNFHEYLGDLLKKENAVVFLSIKDEGTISADDLEKELGL